MGGNPLFDRLTLHSRSPSLRLTVIAGCMLLVVSAVATGMLVSAVPGLFEGISQSDYLRGAIPPGRGVLPWPLPEISAAEGFLIVLLNLAALGLACFLTWREMRSDAFPLLKNANISASQVAAGLAGAALFRLRVPIALALAVLPLTVAPGYFSNYVDARYQCVGFTQDGAMPQLDPNHLADAPCVPADDPRLLQAAIAALLPEIMALATLSLSATAGAVLTLWLRSPWVAGAIALIGVFVLYLVLTAMAPMGVMYAIACLNACVWSYRWPPANGLTLVVLAAPFGLAWAAIRLARYRGTA